MSTITIKASEVTNVVKQFAQQGTTILLTSGPGAAKTAKVKAAIDDLGWKLLFLHGVTCDPVDISGLPFVSQDGKSADFLPAGIMAEVLSATEPTVLFLDDVGQASPSVQAAMMQVVWDRVINGHKIPDCVRFIMASNRRQDKAGVSGMLSTLKDRAVHFEIEPDYVDWTNEFAIPNDVSDKVISFLHKTRGEAFYDFKAKAGFDKSPTARGWELVDRTLKLDLSPEVRLAAIAGCIGEGHAIEFEAFLRIYEDLPSWEAILDDPESVDLPSGESSNHILYALSGVLAKAILADDPRANNAWRWAERMCEAGQVEQAAYLMHYVYAADKAANEKDNTKKSHCVGEAFIRISAGPLADVLHG